MPEVKEKTGTKIINKTYNKGAGEAIYGFGLLGALYYFLQQAHTFVDVVWAILKSIAWPALVVYKVFMLLGL